jgi:hypothetical protein
LIQNVVDEKLESIALGFSHGTSFTGRDDKPGVALMTLNVRVTITAQELAFLAMLLRAATHFVT